MGRRHAVLFMSNGRIGRVLNDPSARIPFANVALGHLRIRLLSRSAIFIIRWITIQNPQMGPLAEAFTINQFVSANALSCGRWSRYAYGNWRSGM